MSKTSLPLTGQWEFKEYPLSARRMRDLNSSQWQITDVPCSIFNSLIAAGQIKHADIIANPENYSSISEKSWIYRKVFDCPEELLNCERNELVFDGLDTLASIWLNDKLIGKTNNMFIPFRFDVTGLLKPKNNSLLVKFDPAVDYAKKLMSRYTPFSELNFRSPYRVYVRKAQYQFGWDWGPAMPGCGIWRPVRLEGIKKTRLADIHIRTVDCNQQYADIKIAVMLQSLAKEEFLCKLTVSGPGQTLDQNLTFKPGEDCQSTVIHIDKPSLWWPNGYGKPQLYQLAAQLSSGGEIVDQTQKKFGIRTVKVNRSADEHGEKFQFEINGQPVFARGADWIPFSIFAGSATSSDYKDLIGAAVKSNMNMLRVWGGGYYEADQFYQLCNQMGIMVWQDFMFACAYYPDRQWFIKEVETEAISIIKQLRNHPCLVIWCGNNEINWLHSINRFGKGKKLYGKPIYHKLLPRLCSQLDPDHHYITSTPLGPAKNPNDPSCGTVHQWEVWSGHKPIRHYQGPLKQIPRFVTEFGMQSVPSVETLKTFCPPSSLHIGNYAIEKHNYQLDGNSRIYRYLGDLFGTAENLKQFVYFSQLAQARGIKAYVEQLRAYNFRNSGVLFWQLNDCCPSISWSAIDYMKKPKALYYYAKRFFANQFIATAVELKTIQADLPPILNTINVVAVNDSSEPLNAMLNCRLIDLSGSLLDEVTFPVAIGPFTTSAHLKLPKALVSPEKPEKSALHLVMNNNGRQITENLFLYLPDKYIDWPEAQITSSFSQSTPNQWNLKLKSNVLAKDVHISCPHYIQLSDNFIDMLPERDYKITLDFDQPTKTPQQQVNLCCVNSALYRLTPT